ncbi:MAG: HNH endonuclease signature motif containing protein, partial [Gordonia sp. (in: high G+C Gram-positive bacteria)]
MPFFQVDDQLPQSRKTRLLVEPVMDGDIEGLAAIGLWTLAGAQAQVLGGGTDGLVSRADLVRVLLNPDAANRLAACLVRVGFWHAPGHTCERCPAVPQGHWYFHDWADMKYTPAAQATTNKAKRKELQNPQLIAEVWARDCVDPTNPTIGRCRYCGTTLVRNDAKNKDTRSAKSPHLDHVDPYKAAGIRNVVLACGACNQKKGNRTPGDAGMTLLAPPRPTPATTAVSNGDEPVLPGPRDAVKASA